MADSLAKIEQPDDSDEQDEQKFSFNGETYETYQEMVDAKRKRNQAVLRASGLLDAKAAALVIRAVGRAANFAPCAPARHVHFHVKLSVR